MNKIKKRKSKLWMVAMLWVLSTSVVISDAFATTTTPLFSQDEYRIGQGDLETIFAFDPAILRGDFKSEVVGVQLGGNYFVTDMLAPGIDFQLSHVPGTTNAVFVPNLKVYWPLDSKVLPFGRVGLGYAKQYGVEGLDLNLGFGANYMLSNTVALGLQFSYDLVAGDNVVHRIRFPIGFSLYFRL